MTTADSILLLLSETQASSDSIAETLHQPPIVIAAFCCDLEKSGFAKSYPLGNPDTGRKLATWRITDAGRDRAASLTAPV
jgi:predicted ArsR family transcriptional regulator